MRSQAKKLAILGLLANADPRKGMSALALAQRIGGWGIRAGIYVVLMHMKDDKLVTHYRETVLDESGRLPRYFYRITDLGREQLM